jgi:hypothetical protein
MIVKSNLILSRRSQNRLVATSRLVSSWDFFIHPRVLTRFTPYNTRQVTMRYGATPLVASLSLKLS